jgi:negative regulator of sigma E activity
MSELLREQMSAFVDDALSTEESLLLVRRLREDGELSRTYACYHLIGASIRREPDASALALRVRAALSGETLAAGRGRRRWTSLLKPAAGAVIAGAVAVVAIVTLRNVDSERSVPGAPAAQLVSEPETYVVPERNAEAAYDATDPAGQARLARYLVRHASYATMPNPPVMNFRGVGGARHVPAPRSEAAATASVSEESAVQDATEPQAQ